MIARTEPHDELDARKPEAPIERIRDIFLPIGTEYELYNR